MNDEPQKLCFVISPIGADGSPERDAADWFLEIVREALGADYRIERADALKKSGQITAQIIQFIESADLIVADLTAHNPNVHYELGVAHAREKQVVPMMLKGDRLPFDNSHMRTIFYSRANPKDQAMAVAELREAAAAVSEPAQNPVTHALGTLKLSQGDDEERVVASMSSQVDRHDAEISELRVLLNTVVSKVGLLLAVPSRPAGYFNSLSNEGAPQPGGLFGLGGGLLAPSTDKPFADMFVPTKTEPKKK